MKLAGKSVWRGVPACDPLPHVTHLLVRAAETAATQPHRTPKHRPRRHEDTGQRGLRGFWGSQTPSPPTSEVVDFPCQPVSLGRRTPAASNAAPAATTAAVTTTTAVARVRVVPCRLVGRCRVGGSL